MNKETARRCIGVIDKKRCDHYFEWKVCKECGRQNDITSRYCHHCEYELIDPNAKLHRQSDLICLDVIEAKYWIKSSSPPILNVLYKTNRCDVYESYYPSSKKAKNLFYARFIKQHIPNPSEYWPYMDDLEKMIEMIQGEIYTPIQIICKKDEWNRLHITKKIFKD
jgi:ribosomal protein L40E